MQTIFCNPAIMLLPEQELNIQSQMFSLSIYTISTISTIYTISIYKTQYSRQTALYLILSLEIATFRVADIVKLISEYSNKHMCEVNLNHSSSQVLFCKEIIMRQLFLLLKIHTMICVAYAFLTPLLCYNMKHSSSSLTQWCWAFEDDIYIFHMHRR